MPRKAPAKQAIVINVCVGGFSLSEAAILALRDMGNEAALKEVLFGEKWCKNDPPHVCPEEDPDSPRAKHFPHWMEERYIQIKMRHYDDGSGDRTREQAIAEFRAETSYYTFRCDERTDPDLVKVVKKLGAKANGRYSKLKIVRIPADVKWEIDSNDAGWESVHEKHRVWC